jgi:type II secretion system protein E
MKKVIQEKVMNNFFDLTQYEKEEAFRIEQINYFKESLGEDLLKVLNDPTVTEIMYNNTDTNIWIKQFKKGMYRTEIPLSVNKAKLLVEIIASYNREVINRKNPVLSATLPDGERFETIAYDSAKNKIIFSIRKRARYIISLEEYVEQQAITSHQKNIIEKYIKEKRNILVAGGTDSGKTTFLNACIDKLKDSNDRVALIEEIPELRCDIANRIEMVVSYFVKMQELLKRCMRLNPNRIIVGEIREGAEAQTLLKAWNSGHPGGLSTIHADSCSEALHKLELYLSEVVKGSIDYPQRRHIASAINIIVFMEEADGIRKVKEIKEVLGYDKKEETYILKDIN